MSLPAVPSGEDSLLRPFVHALPEPAGIVDGDGRLGVANGALLGILGPSATGGGLLELTGSEQVAQAAARALSGESVALDIELPLLDRTASMRLVPLRPGAVLLLLRDDADARRMSLLREKLISGIGHEVRGALTTIAGSAETLPAVAPDALPFAEIIERASLRLLRILDDATRLVRLESGELKPPLVPLLLDPVCRRAAQAAAIPGRAVILDIAPSLSVWGEWRSVERILVALLETALRWGRKDRPVVVAASPSSASVLVSVAAEGTPWAEPQPELFEPFKVRGEGASGLELALARRLARQLLGEVFAEDGRLWVRLRAAPPA